jgi:ATP/maltotriose-dependent transcriptional regulator MalT
VARRPAALRSGARAGGESPEALLGLANALWWLGATRDSIVHLERAYAAFRRRPDPAQAVLAAVSLCLTSCASLGNLVAARGWAARASRLVEDVPELGPLAGWVLLCRAVVAEESGDPADAERLAREAHAAARAAGDGDLELCALSAIGTALVGMGRLAEGAALLDEAMAGSLGGEADALDTVVMTSCQTMVCCSRAGDLKRARQWVRAADDFHRRYGSPHLYAVCRTHSGSVLFATAQWAEAEVELRAALKIGSDAEPALRAEALAKLAELRLAQGRLGEAEQLIEGLSEQPASVLATAAIHLAHGEPAVAATVLERRLAEIGEECLEAAAALELLAEAQLERGVAPGDLLRRAGRLAELGERGAAR